jgi:hypothetical protein
MSTNWRIQALRRQMDADANAEVKAARAKFFRSLEIGALALISLILLALIVYMSFSLAGCSGGSGGNAVGSGLMPCIPNEWKMSGAYAVPA